MEEREITGKGSWRWILLTVFLLLLICSGILCWLWCSNVFTLDMELEGEQEIFLEYGTPYEDAGVSLWYSGTHLLKKGIQPETPVLVDSPLNLDRLGRYVITYSAQYHSSSASAQRIVWVVDTQCPVIELSPTREEPLLPGDLYQEDGYRATDNYDGDITHLVIRTEQEGRVIYGVADSSGNPCYVQRELPYYDPIPPQIQLEGPDTVELLVGIPYEEPGYTAWDNVDGDMTHLVTVEGEVDFCKPGVYPISYSVTDDYGNVTTVVRNVEVAGLDLPEIQIPQGKVIYLTFDDGPGPHTSKLLDILEQYGVKATFFVVDSGMDWVLKDITDRGHSIGVHTMTHDYGDIYASPEAYFQDLYGMQGEIFEVTGVKTYLMRFPGGGSNTISISNPGIMTLLTKAVQDAGFRYFDWNVDSNDAGGAKTSKTVLGNIMGGVMKQQISVVLQHDIHGFSVDAVEELIIWALDNGYTFLPLDMTSPECHHGVRN